MLLISNRFLLNSKLESYINLVFFFNETHHRG